MNIATKWLIVSLLFVCGCRVPACAAAETESPQVAAGANVNIQQKVPTAGVGASTPLHLALYFECNDAIALLLERGASLPLKDANGRTPLDRATPEQRKILLEHAAVQKPDKA